MKQIRGFTLIELMIVIAIIAIIAAIALPSLLRSRIAANEASAISSLRTINSAQQSYRMQVGTYGWLSNLSTGTPPYIDAVLGSGTKSGYFFDDDLQVEEYDCTAIPAEPGVTGVRYFNTNTSGVIYQNTVNSSIGATPID